MPRVLIAPNAFKGSLSAAEAAKAMAAGARKAGAQPRVFPISDGGDGLLDVFLSRFGGRRIAVRVRGPVGDRRRAAYGWFPAAKTAVVEMAQASGIAGLKRSQLDPMGATSYGTGELIRAAAAMGARTIIVGLGGSATNDGGAGMAAALGARLLGKDGRPLPLGAEPLLHLESIDASGLEPALRRIKFIGVSDVTNPLLGKEGSARVYGPQKGATPAQVRLLEKALARYAKAIERDLGVRATGPRTGAAGGLGAGLKAFLGAKLESGSGFILEQIDAGGAIGGCDLVVTGEGKLDEQSFFGKAPIALADLARRAGVPAAIVCGQSTPEAVKRLSRRRTPVYELRRPGESLAAAIAAARVRLQNKTKEAVSAFLRAACVALCLAGSGFGQASFQEIDRLYYHRHEPGSLEKSQAQLQKLEPSAEALWRLGRGLVRQGELAEVKREKLRLFGEAERSLRKAVELDEKNVEAHYWLGIAMGRAGQTRGVLKSLFLIGPIRKEMRRVLELDPKHSGAHHVLGEMLRQIPAFAGGSKKGAAEELEKAVELNPRRSAHYVALARAYMDLGETEKARSALSRLDRLSEPDDPAEHPSALEDAAELRRRLD